MRHLPMIMRQVRRSSRQAGLFVLCVTLSLTTLTAFSGFAGSVARALRDDARSLHAADILIQSYDPISAPLIQAVDRLDRVTAPLAGQVKDQQVGMPGIDVHGGVRSAQAAAPSGQTVYLSSSRFRPERITAGERIWPAWRRSS